MFLRGLAPLREIGQRSNGTSNINIRPDYCRMAPWYRGMTDLGDRGGETAIRSIRRAAVAIKGGKILIARAKID